MNDLQENKHRMLTKYITRVLLKYLEKNSTTSDKKKYGLIRKRL